MKVVSVNVSMGRQIEWQGRTVETGIFKEPVTGPVLIRRTNLEGDRQSDLRVHGGEFKAVYGYGAQHYARWEEELGRPLPPGMFGENLTIEELDEVDICVGDTFRIGEATLEAVQPRQPCFKLGVRFDDPGMVKRFMQSGRSGVYFRVVDEGRVEAGDPVTRVARDPARFPIAELTRLLDATTRDPAMIERALALSALPPGWRDSLHRMSGRETSEPTPRA